MNGFITTILIISGVMLAVAAVLTTFRLIDGPSSLDRLVALDTIVAVAMCGLAVWAAYSGDTTIVPAIVALALVGFIGSVSVARFRVSDR
ncbi:MULTISPECIES: monovalent cation/H+ antiporter complex subunit F [Rhodococcus]|jgi:multicomponent Na+:H+ antiporter subunit F|uniref:Multisubunit sodium/proton antiporter MrpF subunit n=1 Tax=Nocardia globerula TaxID=1818 RepID=A0A652YWF3_NOCGL|nr:monovalent cation/H+ antiporter complex subunit F [Rhodococcus sp. MS16]KJF23282.1 putative monovalent cation/H antiporter subunit F [Rhodococcus sp. AD45]PVX64184.1 multisubunit sodium/proton antiporter MrpF subunit [Rhodococcus globerulus]